MREELLAELRAVHSDRSKFEKKLAELQAENGLLRSGMAQAMSEIDRLEPVRDKYLTVLEKYTARLERDETIYIA
jgi:uncharacterized coiled-coil DUF342 family protein